MCRDGQGQAGLLSNRRDGCRCAHKALGKGQALELAWKDGFAIDGGFQRWQKGSR